MAWTAPKTWALGELLTSSDLNTYIRDNNLFLFDSLPKVAIIADVKSSGTDGGASVAGAWYGRDLNTKVSDPDGIVSIATNEFTLGAGTYWIEAKSNTHRINGSQIRIYNVTDSAVVVTGLNVHGTSASQDSGATALVSGLVTIASSKAFAIEYRCETSRSTDGLGHALGWGDEKYTEVTIVKVG